MLLSRAASRESPADQRGMTPHSRGFQTGGGLLADQRGITLQTLVITAVLVAVAVVASVLIVAISRSSGERLEDSNATQESLCQPWEVHKVTLAAKGYGGTQGHGGIFSSSIGCIAVCYLTGLNAASRFQPTAMDVSNRHEKAYRNILNIRSPLPARRVISRLAYDDSNRGPVASEVRLGVAYNRAAPADADDFGEFYPDFGYWRDLDDTLNPSSPRFRNTSGISQRQAELFWTLRDPDPSIRYGQGGENQYPGIPIPLEWRGREVRGSANRVNPWDWSASLHVYEPNFWSPASGIHWTEVAKEWEVRADPGRKVCEIVDTARDDEIMLTSAREYDPSNPYPESLI